MKKDGNGVFPIPSRERRTLIGAGVSLAGAAIASGTPLLALGDDKGATSDWPTRPILVIDPFAVGGVDYTIMRAAIDKLGPVFGQPIILENRPGAAGNIGTRAAAQSNKDGYTWLVTTVSLAAQGSLRPYQQLQYDARKDFQPVALLATSPHVLVVPTSTGVSSVREFVAHAKARPNPLTFAHGGNGTGQHLSSVWLFRALGIDSLPVVYKGQPPAVVDVISGRIDCMVMAMTLAAPQLKAGKLKGLAIVDATRYEPFPDLPTTGESGYPDSALPIWVGLFMPSGTPAPIVQRVNSEIMKALQQPDIVARLNAAGIAPNKPHAPAEFEKFFSAEIDRIGGVIKEAGIQVE